MRVRIGNIPERFIAIFALIYISGYIVDSFYYNYIGIADLGSEPFKLHYIQIGLVFILGYVIIVSVLVFSIFGCREMYEIMRRPHRPISHVLVTIVATIFTLSIYVFAIFTQANYFQNNPEHLSETLYFIGTVTFGLLIIMIAFDFGESYLRNLINSSKFTETVAKKLTNLNITFEIFRSFALLVTLVIMIILDYMILEDFVFDMKEMLMNSGWVYLALALVFSVLLFRLIKRLEITEPGFGQTGIICLSVGIVSIPRQSRGLY